MERPVYQKPENDFTFGWNKLRVTALPKGLGPALTAVPDKAKLTCVLCVL